MWNELYPVTLYRLVARCLVRSDFDRTLKLAWKDADIVMANE